jgi:signal peptidase II
MSLLTRPGRIGLVLAAALIAVDQATKAWAINLPELVPHDVVWPLRWTRIWNEGVSFGLLQASHDLARWALFAFSVIVGALLANWARTQTRLFPAAALGLIVAGAWGNAIDRAIHGAVIDFVDVSELGFFPYIFNVADAAITIGVILLIWDSFKPQTPPPTASRPPPPDAED